MPRTLENGVEMGLAPMAAGIAHADGVFRRALVVLDDSAAARDSVEFMRDWVGTFGGEVRYLAVVEHAGGRTRDQTGSFAGPLGGERVVAHGRTLGARNRSLAEGVARAAEGFGADVLVLGCDHRRLARRHLCTSLRDRLARVTDLPVIVAPTGAGTRFAEHRRGPSAAADRAHVGYAHV